MAERLQRTASTAVNARQQAEAASAEVTALRSSRDSLASEVAALRSQLALGSPAAASKAVSGVHCVMVALRLHFVMAAPCLHCVMASSVPAAGP